MSGYTPPPRYAGIIELAGNGEKDLGAQSLAGKILISNNLEAGNWPQSQNGKECEFPKAWLTANPCSRDKHRLRPLHLFPASSAETKSARKYGCTTSPCLWGRWGFSQTPPYLSIEIFLTSQRQANSQKNAGSIPRTGSRWNNFRQFRRPYGTRLRFSAHTQR